MRTLRRTSARPRRPEHGPCLERLGEAVGAHERVSGCYFQKRAGLTPAGPTTTPPGPADTPWIPNTALVAFSYARRPLAPQVCEESPASHPPGQWLEFPAGKALCTHGPSRRALRGERLEP
jgi:hypothetical protein